MFERKMSKDRWCYKLEIPEGMDKFLTKKEERRLLYLYRDSDNSNISIRDTLFWANIRYVISFINQEFEKGYLYGIEKQDVIAEGICALFEAIEKVDPYSQNTKRLGGYAEYFILNRVHDLINLTRNIPISTSSPPRKFTEKVRELEQNLGRPLQREEIDEYLRLKFSDYKKRKIEIPQTISLDNEDEQGVKLGDKLIKRNNGDGFNKIEAKIEADEIFRVLKSIKIYCCSPEQAENYKEMFKMKYGRGDSGESMKLREIGRVFGISRQAVSKDIITVIKALRKKMKIHPL